MKKILIADSGSTKTDWCCIDRHDPGERIEFRSQGYNPNYISGPDMEADIREALPAALDPLTISEIHFYGAGVTELQYPFVEEVLRKVFTKVDRVFLAMDTLASARALLGRQPGFAVILGTGMNSCMYDGTKLTLNIDSLGFIMGDEGSGSYLGKQLISDFIRGDMPEKVRSITAAKLGKNGDELIDIIYTKPFPNRFCAQYSRFVGENLDTDPYFRNLVQEAFRSMFRKIITHYPNYSSYSFNCVGSVGYAFRDILGQVCAEFGMQLGRVLQYPMDGLVEYHRTDE